MEGGERVVIPQGVDHNPVWDERCTVLMVEPEGTLNTGTAGRAFADAWVSRL